MSQIFNISELLFQLLPPAVYLNKSVIEWVFHQKFTSFYGELLEKSFQIKSGRITLDS